MRSLLCTLAVAVAFAFGVGAPALAQSAADGLGSSVTGRALANPGAAASTDLIITYRGQNGDAVIGPVSSVPTSSIISGITPCTGCASGGVLFNGSGGVTANGNLTATAAGNVVVGNTTSTLGPVVSVQMNDGAYGAGVNVRNFSNGTASIAVMNFQSFNNAANTGGSFGWWGANVVPSVFQSSIVAEASSADTGGLVLSAFNGVPLRILTGNRVEAARFSPSGGFSIGTTTDAGATNILVAGTITNPGIGTDATHADTAVCQDTATHLQLSGSGTLGACLGTSGRQFKTDFAPMTAGLDEIMRIKLWNYRYRRGYGDGGARLQRGPTAQDVEDVIPDLVGHDASGEAINYDIGAFVPISLRAIQQLKTEFDAYRLSRP